MASSQTNRNPQELFWAGEFGDSYSGRNRGQNQVACNQHFFIRALEKTRSIQRCLELGANIGLNLQALRLIHPEWQLQGIEINEQAANALAELLGRDNVYQQSILEFNSDDQWDLVIAKGLLIHIAPEQLPIVYDRMYRASARYVLIAEYFSPTPTAVTYRGHEQRLFKRDFAGEMLDRFPQMKLLDYGFVYHRDVLAPQDDLNWFLLEK